MNDTLRERAIEAACSTYFGSEAWEVVKERKGGDGYMPSFFRRTMGHALDSALSVLHEAREQEDVLADLLAQLVERLPADAVDVGNGHMQYPEIYLNFNHDDGWEIEWVPLDHTRNYAVTDPDLATALRKTIAYHDGRPSPAVTCEQESDQ